MMMPPIAEAHDRWLRYWLSAALLMLAQAAHALPECSSNCTYGPCTLVYGAAGFVRDSVTHAPIAGAQIVVLDAEGVSGADGSYRVSGSRVDTCHLDWFWSITVSAPGYKLQSGGLYESSVFPNNLTIELEPNDGAQAFAVFGVVTEFQPCAGRMRGVDVVLDPLGLTVETSIDASAGGSFEFTNVPPGDYTLHVVQGCNPYGCWEDTPVHVEDNDVNVNVCVGPLDLPPTPTPCPVETPCMLGERPRPCSMAPCGLGCGCEPCPPCPDGAVLAPHYNRCDCDFPAASPTPSPTPDLCRFSTPPLCSVGEHVECDAGACPEDCRCVACDPCPDGFVYRGEPNQCECVDPREFTPTFTPTPTPTGPTPTVCPERTQCPAGQHPAPCSDLCGLGCRCEAMRSPVATADVPSDQENQASSSNGGCAIVHGDEPRASPWLWPLVPLVFVRRSMRRRRSTPPSD